MIHNTELHNAVRYVKFYAQVLNSNTDKLRMGFYNIINHGGCKEAGYKNFKELYHSFGIGNKGYQFAHKLWIAANVDFDLELTLGEVPYSSLVELKIENKDNWGEIYDLAEDEMGDREYPTAQGIKDAVNYFNGTNDYSDNEDYEEGSINDSSDKVKPKSTHRRTKLSQREAFKKITKNFPKKKKYVNIRSSHIHLRINKFKLLVFL